MEFKGEENVNEIVEAQNHVAFHTFNFINSMSLRCAIQLGIPDIIHKNGQPMSLSELVAASPIHPTKAQHVHRLMRVLVHCGFFTVQERSDDPNHEEECYSLTLASRVLLKDHPLTVRPLLLMSFDPVFIKPWDYLDTWFQNDDPTPFTTAHGKPLWEYCAALDPRFNDVFNQAMASDNYLVSRMVLDQCKGVFEGVKTLVDVGGGTGAMAKNIAEAFPKMECFVLDLPHVVADLHGTKNLKFIVGDFFVSIPPADAVLLKWILHDWNDKDSVKILGKCKEAILANGGQEGKVIIIDMVVGNQDLDEKSTELQLFFDLRMLVEAGGQERNEKEWAKLFFDAGFSNYKISQIQGPRALIEVYA